MIVEFHFMLSDAIFIGSRIGAEPMVMGSPSSPHSSMHNTSQYLPGFLLGDHTPGPAAMHSVSTGVIIRYLLA